MTQVLDQTQQAEKRALKRLKAEGYAKMPNENVLKAAAAVEQVRLQGIDKTDTALIQRANLTANVLMQHTELLKEKIEPKAAGYMEMVEAHVAFATTLAKQGVEIAEQRGKEFEVPDEDEDDDEPLGGGEGE